MNKRKAFVILASIASALILAESARAQFRSAAIFGQYSEPITKRLGVTDASAWGGGFELRYDVTEEFGISFTGLYEYWWIEQPDALEQWNWDFWIQRYKGIVEANLASDPNLSATLTPEVVMESIPIYLSASFEFEAIEDLRIRPYAGAGVYFYRKKLFLHETWGKYFPGAQYTLTYDYLNFAPAKEGKPFMGVGGVEVSYRPMNMLEIAAAVHYMQVLGTQRGYDEMPMENALSVRLGLGFVY